MNHRNILDLRSLVKDLQKLVNKDKAQVLARFFKTGKGQYGEGDIFLGITVPRQRKIAKKYQNLTLSEVEGLLKSKIHEHRLTALLILVAQFKKASSPLESFPRKSSTLREEPSPLRLEERESRNWIPNQVRDDKRKKIVDFYLKNTRYINNWDLVDLSANHILGEYLLNRRHSGVALAPQYDILERLAKSKNLWERRIAIISTWAFIRRKAPLIKKNQFDETLKIAKLLLTDNHDLIQKAVGWMLREVGKRNQEVEEQFLKQHYKQMPRTMLRYSIERFSERKKKYYMV